MLKLLAQEDTFWKQRSKFFWLQDGDSNSKFFHSTASTRRRSNRIKGLYNEDGIYVDNIDDMCRVALHYFENLFSERSGCYDTVLNAVTNHVRVEENESLLRPFTHDEFNAALWQMHPDKSLGHEYLMDGILVFTKNFGQSWVVRWLGHARVGSHPPSPPI